MFRTSGLCASLALTLSFAVGCSGTDDDPDGSVLGDTGTAADAGPAADSGPAPTDTGVEVDGGTPTDAGGRDAALEDTGTAMDAGTGSAMDLPVTFDDPAVAYGVQGFAGAEMSSIVVDPTDANNTVVQVIRADDAQVFAGTTITADEGATGFASPVPFDAENTRMTVRVWSPQSGIRVRLKLEDANDPTSTVETEAVSTVASDWETLTFDFSFNAPGTPPLDFAKTYDLASVFMNFGVEGSVAGEQTYYFDDIVFIGGTSGGGSFETLTFDDPAVTYTLIGFGGANATVVVDPVTGSGNVAELVKTAAAELWGGVTTATGPQESVPTIPITAMRTRMSVRVWSPDANIPVRLKIEDASDPTRSVETEATVTSANTWETLTFDFSNEAMGTAALNPSYTFNKVSIFFNFGTAGDVAGEKTYYYDDIALLP